MTLPPPDETTVTPTQGAPDQPPVPWLALGLATLALAVTLVGVLGATIARGGQFAFDRAILLKMREPQNLAIPEGPLWIKHAMLDITALGGTTVLTLISVLTVAFLLVNRHLLTAALLASGIVSGSLAVTITKFIVGRARPALIDHYVDVNSLSFPSGHAANSATAYLTIALVVMQITPRPEARRLLLGVAVALVMVIGCSRVYLGVHWPSDVLAGWTFGALWALGWWAIGAWFRQRLAGGQAPSPPVGPLPRQGR